MRERHLTIEVLESQTQTLECPVMEPDQQTTEFEWTRNGVPVDDGGSLLQHIQACNTIIQNIKNLSFFL